MCLKTQTEKLQKAAYIVAIIDTICTAVLLILFVLGSSLMVAFEIVGKENNATRVLDIVTDNVFGTVQKSYNTLREKKDVAEDMGVWLIVMFLTFADFIISCIFLDGVRTKDERKCQIWLNIRIIILVVFKIILMINLVYGTNLITAIPDFLYTLYRIAGLIIGYEYIVYLRGLSSTSTSSDSKTVNRPREMSVVRRESTKIPTLEVTDANNFVTEADTRSIHLCPCPSTSSFNSTRDPSNNLKKESEDKENHCEFSSSTLKI